MIDAMSHTLIINPLRVWDEILAYQPEVIAITGVPQDAEYHPEGTVDVHTRMTIQAAQAIGRSLPDDEKAVLLWTMVCHDLGKATTTEYKNGRVVSPKHAAQGELPTITMLTRLGVSHDIIVQVVDGVREHMAHLNGVDERMIKRLAARMTLGVPLLAMVIIADYSARPWANTIIVPAEVRQIWDVWATIQAKAKQPKPLLTGQDLIEAGMSPGPSMGQVLKKVAEAQQAGLIHDRETALAWAMESK